MSHRFCRTCDQLKHSNRSQSMNSFRRFNLAPEYQHVKASFYDTTKDVIKLRQKAEERRL